MAAAMTVRQPRSRHSPVWVFVPIATAFVIIAAIAIYGQISPYNAKKPPAPGHHGSLVWGDGIFANKLQLEAWLSQHGASYGTWAKTHPKALALVKPRPRHPATLAAAKKKSVTTKKVAARSPATPVAAPRTTSSSSSHTWIGTWIVVVLGLLLGIIAATPRGLLERLGVEVGYRERELRLATVGTGAALLLAVIAVSLLG